MDVNGPEGLRKTTKKTEVGGLQPLQQLIYGGDYPEKDSPGDYRFNVRDRMRVIVTEHPEFSGRLSVLPDGTIRIPNTNDFIPARGHTKKQLIERIERLLSKYIRGEVKVNISITLARGEFYYIFGEVQNSGRFPLGLTPIRLSEAVFRANSVQYTGEFDRSLESRIEEETSLGPRQGFDLSPYANLMQVSVITPHRSRPTRRQYNIKKALFQGVLGEDPIVRSGQIIWVPSTFDQRLIKFFTRVIAPIQAIGSFDSEAAHWYGRITGNKVKGVTPTEYQYNKTLVK